MRAEAKKVEIAELEYSAKKFKNILGMEIAYTDVGEGDVLFCLPPWPSGSMVFTPLGCALKDHSRVIALDLPGWGGHSSKMLLDPTVYNYAKIVKEFLDSFDLRKYSLLGYSFGGVVAQVVIEEFGVRPHKVIMVSTLHSGDEIHTRKARLFRLYRFVSKYFIPDFIVIALVRYIMSSHHSKNPYVIKYGKTEYFKKIVNDDVRASAKPIVHSLISLFHLELLDPDVMRYKYLVIYGDEDLDFIKKESQEMANFLKVQPVVLQNANHDHFAFDINLSSQIILDFLKK